MLLPIKDYLDKSIQHNIKRKYQQQLVVYHWNDVVGEPTASHVSPGKFLKDTLTVHTDSSVWSHQVLIMKQDIIQKINTFAGKKLVKDLHIKAGYQKRYRPLKRELPSLGEYLNKVELHPEEITEIETKVRPVQEEKLKSRLVSILKKQKKLDRLKLSYGWHPCKNCTALCAKNEAYCTVCSRRNQEEKRAQIRSLLLDAPFLTYAQLNNMVACNSEEYLREKINLLQKTYHRIETGDRSDMTRSLFAMLVTGMMPDRIDEELIEKTLEKFGRNKYVFASWK